MKYTLHLLGFVLTLGIATGCTGFAESLTGAVAGNGLFLYVKKLLTNPVSRSQTYGLPASRMVGAVSAVFRNRGYSVVIRDIEGEDPGMKLLAEKTKKKKSVNLEISAIVRPLSTTKSSVEVRVRSTRKGRTRGDDLRLSQEIVNEVSKKVRWG